MRAIVQLIASAAALAALLAGVASQATPLAELPLKASVLAKPNVVFAMDDSGSMDWEIMLGTDNGLAWWNGSSTAWDITNNKPLESTSSDSNQMAYLFPMGDDGDYSGGQMYNNTGNYGRAVPPIGQLAWLRSSAFNPLYYNTMVTYPAWSPAYVNGAQRPYSNESTSAARGHPGPFGSSANPVRTLNVGADWNSSSSGFDSDRFSFSVMPGMVLPAGTSVNAASATSGVCSGSTRRTLAAATTVAAGERCQARIPYYPATFWQRTVCPSGDTSCVAAPDCTVVDPTTDPTSACVNSPDGLGKLRRYEIKSGNTFTSSRTWDKELQNFANWFTYYRKRKLMLAGAMGRALEPVTGLRFGVVPFNDRSRFTGTMWDADAKLEKDNRFAAAGQFYLNSMSPQGTPTRGTIKYIGDIYDSATSIVQYACQRNSMFVVTDGFANDGAPTVPSYNAATYGGSTPFQTTIAGSMADQALAYYTNRLRTDLTADRVPAGDPLRKNPDLNTNLHITTYGITLGARGKLYPTALNPFAVDVFASPPVWPTPVANDPTMVDDLWHATVNGRGKMFMANDVETMRLSIQSAFSDIQNQEGAQAGIAVSAVNLDRGDSQAYLASYNPAGWAGDLTASPIAKATGEVDVSLANQKWSAAKLLSARDWSTRIVFSSSASSGVDFSTANVGSSVKPWTATFTEAEVVEYLRGNGANDGTLFRDRSRTTIVNGTEQKYRSLIGAVINAEPVLAREEKMVYLASSEGMLHAFDTVTGKEEWAYAPPDVLAGMGASAVRGWVFQTLLDATPVYGKLSNGSKMLIGGLGAAGRSYYALDVSSPKGLNASAAAAQFRWTFPAAGDDTNRDLMGSTVGKPVIVKTAVNTDRILVTSGYDNGKTIGDGKGRLWVLGTDGVVKKSFVTGSGDKHPGQEAGLAHVSAFKEPDGTVRYAYAGDLLGNLWRFDLQKADALNIPADLVAVFKDDGGKLQPITAAPELTTVGTKRIILIGTGRILDIGDFGSSNTQSFYAVADDAASLSNPRSAGSGMVKQVYTRGGNPELTSNAFNWANDRGWYFDLPSGEQANTDPIITYGAIAFVTNLNGGADCSQQSYLYLVDIGTGTKVKGSDFVADTISLNATSSRVITLRVVDGKIIGTTHRSDNKVYQKQLPLGATINPSKNAWKEIRR